MADDNKPTDEAGVSSASRRAFFRKMLQATYVAPVVTTVMLGALQPGNPSGGMMTFAPPPPGQPGSPQAPTGQKKVDPYG